MLAQYRWPGNVRELQNVIRRGIALAKGPMIGWTTCPTSWWRPPAKGRSAGDLGYFELRDEHLAQFEQQYLGELLARHHGDVRTAADRGQAAARHAVSPDEEARARQRQLSLADAAVATLRPCHILVNRVAHGANRRKTPRISAVQIGQTLRTIERTPLAPLRAARIVARRLPHVRRSQSQKSRT